MNDLSPRLIGAKVKRIEDPTLLRGRGRYVDDIKLPDTLHATFVRSGHAHALIKSIDTAPALEKPGVIAAFTADDLSKVLTHLRLPLAFPPGKLDRAAMPYVLPPREVCFVGEPIAVVVATSRYLAEDAVDSVVVDYEVLDTVIDPRDGLAATAPKACTSMNTNVFTRINIGYGNCDLEFKTASHVIRESFFQTRGVAHPMEGRGILAYVEPGTGTFMVWSSTQVPHELRDNIVEMLRLENDDVRVIAPDIGGGFGAKFLVYSEEIAIAAIAKQLKRPVKWIEDRREHFLSAIQERDQYWNVEIAVDAQGRLRAVRGEMIQDQGAYAPHSITVPYNSASSVLGPYLLPAYQIEVSVVQTNKPPVIPVRGAGYPQGTFVMERLLDILADKIGIDRAEIRRLNLIPKSAMPFGVGLVNRAGTKVVYDSGDYETCQDKALAAANYAGFPARQAAALREGRFIGIGLAHGVKCTGRGPYESATVRVAPSGRVSIYTGALAIGQGIKTALAQICADTLGVKISDVDVTCGDTAFISTGFGAFASRQTVIAGTSVHMAATAVRQKALTAASQMLATDKSVAFGNLQRELTIVDGKVQVSDRPDLAIPLGRIAVALRGAPGYAIPKGAGVGFEATEHFQADSMAYANSFHVCEVEVNINTGHVDLLRYIALQDSGKLVNPLVADGQIVGSVVHGIGNALFESMLYNEDGQPLTTTFADYLLPTATEIPNIERLLHETLSPLNPMGMKGVGEVSVVPVTSAIASAIDDALSPFGVRVRESPISPVRLLQLIEEARPQKQSKPGPEH
jgi:aerobic carbon-monoxide dehydrogenase large subunit